MPATAPFTPKALAFLRALKRNNRREWFHERRDEYEQLLRAPMAAVVERFGQEFRSFAPDLMADPKKSLYRIWRDTRFSADKRPLKTNVAAVFPHRGGDRHTSAGLYLEISPEWVFAGGGLYMPDPQGLHRIRERIATDPKGFARVVNAAALKTAGGLQGESLKRVPTRLSRRSSRGRAPEDEAVPGLGRVAARAGDHAEVLDGACSRRFARRRRC